MTRTTLFVAVTWTLIVTFLLILPGSEFPTITWLTRIWFDKWLHILFFLLLVVLWSRALYRKYDVGERKKMMIWMVVGWSVYGIIMEFVQHYFIPFRSFDWGDIIADIVGCAIGYLFATYWYIKK